ncbi:MULTISPECIES: acyl-CoA dehydrogenase family protein [unclassified Streptomyces]|uniref:acyl-CoA dehydrogenase family protein n=1 Tax=unclassified Streptomyces TaxID=2593676 RepID=UPI00136A28A4|nr:MULTISPECIES: acyl-CoA dehydrogenase family protein [unclassified Streptomyces]MYY86242.1 acyl-CoA dehydrogenase [Streptomyces sp. SID335]MYZ15695.1 acyl-CoA dehydrogenase [Streptomyces sp. SID337]NDZ84580.1 acyl-CoA/acyl-ACP dehydrogenase [Streptomyces sp. SID10115]NEB49292.1 acyl-CoA/acyl-ACP dehydrogenase [Streptomyces sp. SID339]
MDFTPTEEQAAARDLAAEIFADLATPERLAAAGTGADAELWKALCAAGLPGAVEDIGLLGLVLLLEEQGRVTAQVPFAASCVFGVLAVAAHGTAEQRDRLLPALRQGSAVATGAFPARGGVTASAGGADSAYGTTVADGTLTGTVGWVPWLRDASVVLVATDDRTLWLVRVADARVEPVELTAPWAAGRLVLDGTPGERLGGPGGPGAYEDVLAGARTAFAGLQAGVCAGSLARAVAHTNEREQFGRPLAAKQAVQLRAADAHMDTEAIRVTAYEAAWRRDAGLPYGTHALTAAWWASEAGKRVVHAGQHLHGGAGADLDHPVHRHFLWGRQLDAYLGCGSEVLQELGELITAQGGAYDENGAR